MVDFRHAWSGYKAKTCSDCWSKNALCRRFLLSIILPTVSAVLAVSAVSLSFELSSSARNKFLPHRYSILSSEPFRCTLAIVSSRWGDKFLGELFGRFQRYIVCIYIYIFIYMYVCTFTQGCVSFNLRPSSNSDGNIILNFPVTHDFAIHARRCFRLCEVLFRRQGIRLGAFENAGRRETVGSTSRRGTACSELYFSGQTWRSMESLRSINTSQLSQRLSKWLVDLSSTRGIDSTNNNAVVRASC